MLLVVLTVPFVTWPGSVIFTNIPAFIKAVVFFFFTALIIDTERRLTVFLFVFCTCQVFRILEPLYLHQTVGYWGDSTHLGEGEFADRLSGAPADVVNPNGLGFIIVTMIPYIHYLLWRSRKYTYKLAYTIIMPAMLYALVLTMSRGAFIALLVVIWMLFKESKRKFWMIIIVTVAVMAGWANMSDIHKDRYISLVSSDARQSSTAEGRIQGMVDEFLIAMSRPIIGHGLGTSRETKAHAGLGWLISHNLYAELLIEIGVLGFVIFFAFLRAIYMKYRANREKMKKMHALDETTFAWRLNSALGAVFWMYAVYSVNYFGLSSYYWYMFAGIMLAFSRIYFTDKSIDLTGARNE